MKSLKKLMFAAGLLVVALALIGSVSYAWFSANQRVTAEGMEIVASVPTNLIISADGTTWDSKATMAVAEGVELTPVSSERGYDGSFYYTKGPAGIGGVYTKGQTVSATAVSASGSNGETYYLDIPLYLKVQGESAMNVKLSGMQVMTVEDGAMTGLANAYRVAIFEETTCTAPTDGTAGNLLYFEANDFDAKFVYPIGSTTAVSTTGSEEYAVDSIRVGTSRIKLIVRIWLEGQDIACINANAPDSVTVSLVFANAD